MGSWAAVARPWGALGTVKLSKLILLCSGVVTV